MQTSIGSTLAGEILQQIEQLARDAERDNRPLELDPERSRLFELFVTAEAAGLVHEDTSPDLSADGICRALAERWGLGEAARESAARQSRLPAEQLSRMRVLWSLMRMWMEWTYAWQRWPEFHQA